MIAKITQKTVEIPQENNLNISCTPEPITEIIKHPASVYNDFEKELRIMNPIRRHSEANNFEFALIEEGSNMEDPTRGNRIRLLFDEGGWAWSNKELVLVPKNAQPYQKLTNPNDCDFLCNLSTLPPVGTYVLVLKPEIEQSSVAHSPS